MAAPVAICRAGPRSRSVHGQLREGDPGSLASRRAAAAGSCNMERLRICANRSCPRCAFDFIGLQDGALVQMNTTRTKQLQYRRRHAALQPAEGSCRATPALPSCAPAPDRSSRSARRRCRDAFRGRGPRFDGETGLATKPRAGGGIRPCKCLQAPLPACLRSECSSAW